MFEGHHQDTDENDDSHEEVQEFAGTHSVDKSTNRGVVCVIWHLLSPWNIPSKYAHTNTQKSRYSDVHRQVFPLSF